MATDAPAVAAAPKKPRTGRPSHAVWSHFIRGEKRNKCHHHVYCRYCSQAQAQTLTGAATGPASVECIRGVPQAMLRHLTTCAYSPQSVQIEMKLVVAQQRSKKRSSPLHTPATPNTSLDDLLQLDDTLNKTASSSSRDSRSIHDHPVVRTFPRNPPLTIDTWVQIARSGSVPFAWLYNDHVQSLLPRALEIPPPDRIFALCSSSPLNSPYEMTRGMWTVSVSSWDSVCTRQHTVACSVVRQAPFAAVGARTSANQSRPVRHTFSIQVVPRNADALTRHLKQILQSLCGPDSASEGQPRTICLEEGAFVVGVVCDSAKTLVAARAAIDSLHLPFVSTLCVDSILRLLVSRLFMTHKDVVRQVLFPSGMPPLAGFYPTRQSWATWIDCILAANAIHPLSDACVVLRAAYASTSTSVHSLTLHDVVELMVTMHQHNQFQDVVETVWAALMAHAAITAPFAILSIALHAPHGSRHEMWNVVSATAAGSIVALVAPTDAPSLGKPDTNADAVYSQTAPNGLQWVRLGSYAQNLARRWHMDDVALARDLLVYKSAQTCLAQDASSTGTPSSASTVPTLEAFQSRLQAFTPMVPSLARHIPGLDCGGLTLTARTDVPHNVLLPMVQHQQMDENWTADRHDGETHAAFGKPHLAIVWSAAEWDSICDDVEVFLTQELDELQRHGGVRRPLVTLEDLSRWWPACCRTTSCAS
ncbi:hypothetical protein H310_11266 [Aphanomyces invadans]|uniref:Uncharacterized protein n=1 Tax=Aphanomyces invadans TaxID=157072 RepID=A0A024TMN9_9STRA|nr:hypothetical protein H310_11266 [Aphanomyces invadans]ETV95385.1 hypothetical protein H310_11266 [Aphanomyces invadans]|eukprot:XP_008876086.1 hypothetical protein H310_11266 [Aphanomyces invadans]